MKLGWGLSCGPAGYLLCGTEVVTVRHFNLECE